MKRPRRSLTFLFVLAVFFVLSLAPSLAQAETLPAAPTHFYYDGAGILDNETKQLVDQKGQSYRDKQEAPQVVVATVKSTDGDSIDSYAPDLFKKWQLGNADLDNGILILYAVNDGDRNVRIEVGYGLEDVITDSIAGNILTHAKDDLKSSDSQLINQGLRYTFNAVTTLIDKNYDYPSDKNALSDEEVSEFADDGSSLSDILIPLGVVSMIVLFSVLSSAGRGGRGGRGGPWYWGGGGGWSGGSRSGGSGGFGSFGGGGGFSGGGGSSGGGGASI